MPELAAALLRARHRRRLKDAITPLLSGAGVAAFTFGALSQRITDRNDLMSDPLEAMLLGLAFALASFPRKWAIIARCMIFVPSFFLYLSILLGKNPPLPYGGAFAAAGFYAFFFTALSAYLAERPRLLRLHTRHHGVRRPLSHG